MHRFIGDDILARLYENNVMEASPEPNKWFLLNKSRPRYEYDFKGSFLKVNNLYLPQIMQKPDRAKIQQSEVV